MSTIRSATRCAWLYRIATNRCLNALHTSGRRPRESPGVPFEAPEPTRRGEPLWLEPYPDALLEGIAETSPGPAARYETKEAVTLAFVAALQHLPPRQRVGRFADAFEHDDVERVVALLTDDAWLTMPPEPLEYQGRTAIAAFLQARIGARGGRAIRLVPFRASTQPAFGHYTQDAHAPIARASGLLVLTLEGDRIAAVTRFGNGGVLPHFGLPRTLPW